MKLPKGFKTAHTIGSALCFAKVREGVKKLLLKRKADSATSGEQTEITRIFLQFTSHLWYTSLVF